MSDISYDFSQVPDGTVEELLRQGQECLAGTVQLAIASDQRATALAGIFGAGFVALLATGAAIFTGDHYNASLFFACISTAMALFAASFICAWAARPTDFYLGGYEPRHLSKSSSDLSWMKRYASEDVQQRINANGRRLKSASRCVAIGALLALISPGAGLLAIWLSYHPS